MIGPDRRVGIATVGGALASIAITAVPAAAHTGHAADSAWSGLAHPLLGPDHILAMVTVGVLAAVLARPFRVPLAFLAAMAVGGALGMAGASLPFGEIAIALSVVALGGALVAGAVSDPRVALGLVAVAGLAHGHAHGAEAPSSAQPVLYVTAFLMATAALHASGVLLGMGIANRPRTRAAIGATVMGLGSGLVAGLV